jgi:hypothetical protein
VGLVGVLEVGGEPGPVDAGALGRGLGSPFGGLVQRLLMTKASGTAIEIVRGIEPGRLDGPTPLP